MQTSIKNFDCIVYRYTDNNVIFNCVYCIIIRCTGVAGGGWRWWWSSYWAVRLTTTAQLCSAVSTPSCTGHRASARDATSGTSCWVSCGSCDLMGYNWSYTKESSSCWVSCRSCYLSVCLAQVLVINGQTRVSQRTSCWNRSNSWNLNHYWNMSNSWNMNIPGILTLPWLFLRSAVNKTTHEVMK